MHPADLGAFPLQQLIERTGIDPERVDDVIGGCVTQVGEQGCNVTRNAWLAAGLPLSVPAVRDSIDRSRRRLGQDRLDLVQLQWWDLSLPGWQEAAQELSRDELGGRRRFRRQAKETPSPHRRRGRTA